MAKKSKKKKLFADIENHLMWVILISKEVVYRTKNSLKYFIGYIDEDDVIRPLCLKLPQMIGYLMIV